MGPKCYAQVCKLMNIAINLLVFYEVIKQNIYEKAKVKLFTGQTLNKQTDFSLRERPKQSSEHK